MNLKLKYSGLVTFNNLDNVTDKGIVLLTLFEGQIVLNPAVLLLTHKTQHIFILSLYKCTETLVMSLGLIIRS